MDAIAIQDANKIRVAMGLAPLPVPGEDVGLSFKSRDDGSDDSDANDHISTLEKRQAAAGDNWKRLQDEEKARADRVARKEALKRERDAAQRFAKLEGRGLGEADEGGELDTKAWLLQQKRRQKKIDKARRYEEEQAQRELEEQQQRQYTASDLAGVKVGHELDQFGDGDEQVLTLKDTKIGRNDGDEDEEDELENLDLRAQERLKEKLELKKKKPVYNPNDVDDAGEKSILAHYDEEIDGKKRKAFTLDGQGSIAKAAAQQSAADARLKGISISLESLIDDVPVSDYQDPSTAKIRKPKKKKARTTRQKAVDEDDIVQIANPPAPSAEGAMDLDHPQSAGANGTARKRAIEFDDDDLQAQLAEQRRQALKKRKKTDAAELARRMREEESNTPMETAEDDDDEPGMIIDETTEFVSNLKRRDSTDERPRAASTPARDGTESPGPDADGDTDMAPVAVINDEDENAASTAAQVTSTGFEAEETMSQGIGASLSMLRKRGLVQDTNAGDQNARDRAREQFLAENRELIAEYDARTKEQRERDRHSGKFDRMSARDREAYARQQNEQREAYLARLQADHFAKSYKPDVKLRYNDEFGREMNVKEAFKHLSHQFHGKGSGKQKTEKRLKKIEDEKRREAKSSLDSSQHTGVNSAMGVTARKNRQAGVRLQ
ncbi:hypothetical protein MBLNU459_g6381t1 [Dothideomycetes sp. NU459]